MKLIKVYTTSYCPYCRAAKQFLEQKQWPFEEVDLTDDRQALQRLKDSSGLRTVPQIFFGDTLIGGYTDMVALEQKNKLFELLQK